MTPPLFGMVMKGKVYDRMSRKPLADVNIINLNTQLIFRTDSTGLFTITVHQGDVIQFKAHGYQTAQVVIHTNHLPFYSIGLRKGAYQLPEIKIRGHNFVRDSLETQKIYRWALYFPKLEGLNALEHPFSALSKQNRRVWAFQRRFNYFEKQKFIDYVFNKELITKITGLEGNRLQKYRKFYRPSYAQIQHWTTYEFLEYIKNTGDRFKYYHQHRRKQ